MNTTTILLSFLLFIQVIPQTYNLPKKKLLNQLKGKQYYFDQVTDHQSIIKSKIPFNKENYSILDAIIPDFQVNQQDMLDPKEGINDFVITWSHTVEDQYYPDIYAQRYNEDGRMLGRSFRVNDDTNDISQIKPAISNDGVGNFIITWVDSRNGNLDIYAQHYSHYGEAIGTNFMVNDDEGSSIQSFPSISSNSNGNFVIVWMDHRNEKMDIYGQRYSNDGNPLGSNFKINEVELNGSNIYPSVSVDYIGNFIITWHDRRSGYNDIYFQRYSNNGSKFGGNTRVNYDGGDAIRIYPCVTMYQSGSFMIAWKDFRNQISCIYAQLYSKEASPIGANIKINDFEGTKDRLSISSNNSGQTMIIWRENRNGVWDIYAQLFSDNSKSGVNFKIRNDRRRTMSPNVYSIGTGNFVIKWNDLDEIIAQLYSSEGNIIGTNFHVNLYQHDEYYAYGSSIGVDRNGNFVISYYEDGNILAQPFSSYGGRLGKSFRISEGILGPYIWGSEQAMAMNNLGNFVVVWQGTNKLDEEKPAIYGQRYSNLKTAVGQNFIVNDHTDSNYCSFPDISINQQGDFIITWEDYRNGNYDIYAQRYSSTGISIGENFRVNDNDTSGGNFFPSVCIDNDGNILIVWSCLDTNNSQIDVHAQYYSNSGSPVGSNFKVNKSETESWSVPTALSIDGLGNFVIAWITRLNEKYEVYMQRYSKNGAPIGENIKVNDNNVDANYYNFGSPSLSLDEMDNTVITWRGNRDEVPGIFGQRFSNTGNALGKNFRISEPKDESYGTPTKPDVKLWNGRIYNTWSTAIECGRSCVAGKIWANVLKWDEPVGLEVENLLETPMIYQLFQNYPNPFNPRTKIKYSIPKQGKVTLKIFDVLGSQAITLVNKEQSQGNYEFEFDGSRLSSGIYFYRLQAGNYINTKKMILIK